MRKYSVVVDADGNDKLWTEERKIADLVDLFSRPHRWVAGAGRSSTRALASHYFIAVMNPRSAEPRRGYARVTGISGTGMLLIEARQISARRSRSNIGTLLDQGKIVLPKGATCRITKIKRTSLALVHAEMPSLPTQYAIAAWHLAFVSGSLSQYMARYAQEVVRSVRRDGTVVDPGTPGPVRSIHRLVESDGVRFAVEGGVKPEPPCLMLPGEEVGEGTYDYENMLMKMYPVPPGS
jgi:hypothetical protein